MSRHPFYDTPSPDTSDPRGPGAADPTPEVVRLMCQRLSMECRLAAQDVQRAAKTRDDDAVDLAKTTFYDALAREEEWIV